MSFQGPDCVCPDGDGPGDRRVGAIWSGAVDKGIENAVTWLYLARARVFQYHYLNVVSAFFDTDPDTHNLKEVRFNCLLVSGDPVHAGLAPEQKQHGVSVWLLRSSIGGHARDEGQRDHTWVPQPHLQDSVRCTCRAHHGSPRWLPSQSGGHSCF